MTVVARGDMTIYPRTHNTCPGQCKLHEHGLSRLGLEDYYHHYWGKKFVPWSEHNQPKFSHKSLQ